MPAPSLQHLDFVSEGGELVSGLVPIEAGEEAVERLDERLAIRDAAAIRQIDFVFFRRFADTRSSQVVAYVVDNERQRLTEPELAELHKRVWLHGGVPLIYVAWPTRVDVLSCARGPDFWDDDGCKYSPADRIDHLIESAHAVDSAMKTARYSAWRLVDGTFWEDPRNARLADAKQRAHERLIQAVVETDIALNGEKNPLLRRLLLLTVLIKYLEDRRVFPKNWFAQFCRGAKSFFETLRDGEPDETIRLLASLERRFNGDIFALPEGADRRMTKKVLRAFAKLVEAKTINQQRYLWEQFSFEHIPVEIVSHLYQRFVKGGHGTVYTPPFLASLLLDHAMPYDSLRGDERVLDPACGSGVFLVGAFRRLASVLRAKNNWRPLDVATLKDILKRSIFGIELDPAAVDLTSFSLALAVCDMLRPKVIWEQLRFDPLRNRNLLEGDFFGEVRNSREGHSAICAQPFDVILGNPPFESELTDEGATLNQEATEVRGELPDKQAAYLFLEQGIEQLVPGGRLCLLQPSGVLFNKHAFAFRQRIVRTATVDAILDFTSVRNLYEEADPKTAAFLVTRRAPCDDHIVAHLTFRRTFGTRERIAFEIDHYDWHSVPQPVAEDDEFIWRLNLLGGGRLGVLSRRFRAMTTLEEFIERQGMMYSQGFTVGKAGRGKKKGDTSATTSAAKSFLTGMRYLPSKALTGNGIDRKQLTTVKDTEFERERDQSLYDPPLILIRRNERLQMGYWDEGPLAFPIRVLGIGVGKSDAETLEKLFARLQRWHSTYRMACVLHSTESFVAKATSVRKQDIDSLPCPENEAELRLSFWEEAIRDDILKYFCDFVRLGQDSCLLKQAAQKEHMQDYAGLFCRMLGTVYGNLKADSPVFLDGLICQPFYFGERPAGGWIDDRHSAMLSNLIHHEHHESLRTVRLLRFYAGNVMLIIKPDRLRFWIRSTAIRDADETIESLREQGY